MVSEPIVEYALMILRVVLGGAPITMFEPIIGDQRMPEAFREEIERITPSEPKEEEHASLPLSPALLV